MGSQMSSALSLFFQIMTFLFVVAITFAVEGIVGQVLTVRRRLGQVTTIGAAGLESPLLRKVSFRNSFLNWVQSSSSIADPKARLKLARDLALAGIEHPAAPVWYVIVRFSLAIGLPFAFIFTQRLISTPTQGFGAIFWPLVLCGVGLLLPRSLLDRRVERRRAQLEREFPDALDLMVVCVEAGLGLEAAFIRVGQEMRQSHPRIAEEFARVSDQLRAGRSQSEALRGMAERSNASGVKSFAALLIQTEQIGASIAQSLRTYSHEMRETRMLRAEEKALRIPVMMTVPLVCFILPVIVVALMLPAFIDIIRVLIPALTGGH